MLQNKNMRTSRKENLLLRKNMENLLVVVDGTWKNIIKDLLWDVSMNIIQNYGEILVTDIQISENLLLHAIYQHWLYQMMMLVKKIWNKTFL